MSNSNPFLKCKFCQWSILKFKTNNNGKTSGPTAAFERLKDHIYENHPKEFDTIYPEGYVL